MRTSEAGRMRMRTRMRKTETKIKNQTYKLTRVEEEGSLIFPVKLNYYVLCLDRRPSNPQPLLHRHTCLNCHIINY